MVLLKVKTDVGPDNTVTVKLPLELAAQQVTVTVELADEAREFNFVPRNQRGEAIWREQQAYVRLHPELRKTHYGKYVAIRGGEVADNDENRIALWNRMETTYLDRIFYITKVDDMAIPIKRIRSPRIVES